MTGSRFLVAAVLSLAICLTGVAPQPSDPEDHVFVLAQTWTCRTAFGAQTHHVATRVGDIVEITNDVPPANGAAYTLHDRYAFEARSGLWHIELGGGSQLALFAIAPPQSGTTWDFFGRDSRNVIKRVRFELLADGGLRRSFLRETPVASGTWVPYSVERCSVGEAPPPAGTCIAENFPAYAVATTPPSKRDIPPQTPRGTVKVLVQLDARSEIVSAAVRESPSVVLNAAAIESARAARFQTAIRDCRPVAASYLLSISFGP